MVPVEDDTLISSSELDMQMHKSSCSCTYKCRQKHSPHWHRKTNKQSFFIYSLPWKHHIPCLAIRERSQSHWGNCTTYLKKNLQNKQKKRIAEKLRKCHVKEESIITWD